MKKFDSFAAGKVVTVGDYFSVADLAAMKLPGWPRTRKGWYDRLGKDRWEFREVEGKGGRGGIKRQYKPPPDVQELIEQHLRGELPPKPAVVRSSPTRLQTGQKSAPDYGPAPATPIAPPINVPAMAAIIEGLTQAMGPNPDPAKLAAAAAEFYAKMMNEGFITQTGHGKGGKSAA